MSDDQVRFTGRDMTEAVVAARKHFGLRRQDLEIEIIEQPKVGPVDPGSARVTIAVRPREGVTPRFDAGDPVRRGGGERREERRGDRRDRGRGRRRERDEEPPAPDLPPLLPPADVTDPAEILGTLCRGLIAGFDLDLRVAGVTETPAGLRVRLEGEDVPLLLEENAEGLDAFQYLANRILQKDGRLDGRVSVDAGGHREAAEARLVEKARRLAREVLETGRTRRMPPMGPYERRLVHLALAEIEGIRTFSTGSGYQRRLHVAPARKKGEDGKPAPGDREATGNGSATDDRD